MVIPVNPSKNLRKSSGHSRDDDIEIIEHPGPRPGRPARPAPTAGRGKATGRTAAMNRGTV